MLGRTADTSWGGILHPVVAPIEIGGGIGGGVGSSVGGVGLGVGGFGSGFSSQGGGGGSHGRKDEARGAAAGDDGIAPGYFGGSSLAPSFAGAAGGGLPNWSAASSIFLHGNELSDAAAHGHMPAVARFDAVVPRQQGFAPQQSFKSDEACVATSGLGLHTVSALDTEDRADSSRRMPGSQLRLV